MTESLDTLLRSRRSIRKYDSCKIPDKWVGRMIESALTVPSPSNSQPVRFVRVASQGALESLRTQMEAGYERFLQRTAESEKPKKLRNLINYYWRFSRFMLDAPALFAVGTETGDLEPGQKAGGFSERLKQVGIDTGRKGERDLDLSVGLALNAFMLKGTQLGLGTCILTAPLLFMRHPGIPGLQVCCFVTAGFPLETPQPLKSKTPSDIYWEI